MGAESTDVKIEQIRGDVRVILEKISNVEKSQCDDKERHDEHEKRLKSLEDSRATAKGISWGIGSISGLSFIKIIVDLVKGLLR